MPPNVSIIVPCYNEAPTIGGLLEAISDQTHAIEEMEVVIAEGGSTDGTREVIEDFARNHPNLRLTVVDNPNRSIPTALNLAIAASQGAVVIRLDAHSTPEPDYVERCLETLERSQAANVGGLWEIKPGRDTWIGQSIAAAAAHPLGAGDARYRTSGPGGPVDTVPFGAYPREWLDRVGSFSEDLLTNEDYEYNVRIRKQGGVVWFNPSIRSAYVARGSLVALSRQYARYGFWKARMLLRFPASLRLRQALPPLLVLSSLALLVSAPFIPFASAALAVEWGAYAAVLLAAALVEGIRRHSAALLGGFPLATATMHLAWGSAFWWGLLTGLLR
jgi:glycosyltransferase involved in cell wall biosynthesis